MKDFYNVKLQQMLEKKDNEWPANLSKIEDLSKEHRNQEQVVYIYIVY